MSGAPDAALREATFRRALGGALFAVRGNLETDPATWNVRKSLRRLRLFRHNGPLEAFRGFQARWDTLTGEYWRHAQPEVLLGPVCRRSYLAWAKALASDMLAAGERRPDRPISEWLEKAWFKAGNPTAVVLDPLVGVVQAPLKAALDWALLPPPPPSFYESWNTESDFTRGEAQ